MEIDKQKYITLKEAAKISGYDPDYIGQLIRKGKMHGKQVFLNVAWMTTEKDIQEYIKKANGKRGDSSFGGKAAEKYQQFRNGVLFDLKISKLFKIILWVSVVFILAFSFLLFYVFSINFDRKIQERTIEKMQKGEYGREQNKKV